MSLYQAAFVVSCLEVQTETENPEGSKRKLFTDVFSIH